MFKSSNPILALLILLLSIELTIAELCFNIDLSKVSACRICKIDESVKTCTFSVFSFISLQLSPNQCLEKCYKDQQASQIKNSPNRLRFLDQNDNHNENSSQQNDGNKSSNGMSLDPKVFIILFSSVIVVFLLTCLAYKCIKRRSQNESSQTANGQTSVNLEKYDLEKQWPSVLDAEKQCSICLTAKCNIITNCKHPYHSWCLAEWIGKRRVCPACITQDFNPVASYCTQCSKCPQLKALYKISDQRYKTVKNKCVQCDTISLSQDIIEN